MSCFAFRAFVPALACAAALGAALTATEAEAAFVSFDEAALDAVFSQPSFGASPIDVRFAPTIVVVSPDSLDIDDPADLDLTLGYAPSPIPFAPPPVINLIYVDTISECGGYNTSIIGCAGVNGNTLAIESAFAAGPAGTELIAHEIGHNLGLGHVASGLMASSINGSTALTAAETAVIFASPLVQSDGLGLFIEVAPFLVVAAAVATVPAPASGLLLLGAIGAAAAVRRRARA